jgi:uncharacterized membrane protein YqjE
MTEEDRSALDVEEAVETLPGLITRLADQLTQLLEAKIHLLRIELKDELKSYLRSLAFIVAGTGVALIGFSLLNVAVAFLISMLFQHMDLTQPMRYALGFIITAMVYLAVGAVLMIKAKNRIARQGLIPPRTAAELERDREWLKKQV